MVQAIPCCADPDVPDKVQELRLVGQVDGRLHLRLCNQPRSITAWVVQLGHLGFIHARCQYMSFQYGGTTCFLLASSICTGQKIQRMGIALQMSRGVRAIHELWMG